MIKAQTTPGRWQAIVLSLVLVAGLAGCVTQRSGQGVDRDAALESHYKLALGYIDNRNRESARHHIRKAFEHDRNSPQAYAAQAMLFQMEGENERAEDSFKKALRADGDFPQARNNYGAFLFEQERYEDAYEQFKRVAEDLDYDNRARALRSLGRAALKLNRTEEARDALERSHRLDNRQASVLIELATLSFEREDYAQAKEYLDRHENVTRPTPRSLLLGIKIERIFGNKDKEASYALSLKNRFPYSDEYLEYKREMND